MAVKRAGATRNNGSVSATKAAPKRRKPSQRRQSANGGAPKQKQQQPQSSGATPRHDTAESLQQWLRERDELRRWRRGVTTVKTVLGITLTITFILAALAVGLQILGDDLGLSYQTRVFATTGFAVAAALLFGAVLFMPRYLIVRREEREEQKRLRNEAEQSAAEIADANDFTELMKVNAKNMATYTALARGQANTAFRNSQIAMAIGLIVLFVGAVAAIAAQDTAARIATASLTALGGAFAGYIARTFIQSYNSAIEQLNFAFQQPLVNSYLLSSERLVNEMSTDDRKDNALETVVGQLMAIVIRVVRPASTGPPPTHPVYLPDGSSVAGGDASAA
jgi:hypothetical protein